MKNNSKIKETYIFPESTVNKMIKSIRKTDNTKREHAFSLCLDKKSNEIYPGKEYISDSTDSNRVTFESDCGNKELEHIGTYHTHVVDHSSKPSAADINNNCQEYNIIDCIGSSNGRSITCMTKTSLSKECINKVAPLLKKENILLENNKGNPNKIYSNLDKIIDSNFNIVTLKKW